MPSPTTTKPIRLNPSMRPPSTIAATPIFKKQEYDRAIADYDEAIRLNPEDADVSTIAATPMR